MNLNPSVAIVKKKSSSKKSKTNPRLALTLGDPAGIGPEIILKALTPGIGSESGQLDIITVFGSRRILEQTYLNLCHQGQRVVDPDDLAIVDIDFGDGAEIRPGHPNRASGAASFAYLNQAIQQTMAGEFDAIVTAPISKATWKIAGHDYPGQTEVLAAHTQTSAVGMLFLGRSPRTDWVLRTLLATTHIPLRTVSDRLTPELLTQKLDLLIAFLDQYLGLPTPTIALSGLNPHSGEQGQLGQEEITDIIPWLNHQRQRHPQITLVGPVPPDTLWIGAAQAWGATDDYGTTYPTYDAYLALYHDQGLIPVKMLAFAEAVNTTIGLPFIRTSPDHGTAFDIAGQGVASCHSLSAAISWAKELTLC